jgi:uncharacterized protein (DUF983 family)
MTMEDTVFGGVHQSGRPGRPLWNAMRNGFRARCPRCGVGRLFSSFLGAVHQCAECGEEMHHHRADDLPAYLVIVIVGHIVVGAFVMFEATSALSTFQHLAIWVPLTIFLSVALLRPVKGAIIGLQWALRMHGFGESGEPLETHPEL